MAEVVDGILDFFDAFCGKFLLYKVERPQFEQFIMQVSFGLLCWQTIMARLICGCCTFGGCPLAADKWRWDIWRLENWRWRQMALETFGG